MRKDRKLSEGTIALNTIPPIREPVGKCKVDGFIEVQLFEKSM